MKHKLRILALFAVLVISLTSCAAMQNMLKPTEVEGKTRLEVAYGESLATYNDLVDSFKFYYVAVDVETRTELNKTVRRALLQYSYSLDLWKAAQNDTLREDSVIALQRQAIRLMIEHGILKVKEGN